MSTETPNLKLKQFSSSDIVNVGEVSGNFTTVDSHIAFMEVDSLSEIVDPFEGLKALLPTGAMYIYVTGVGWDPIGVVSVDGGKGKKGEFILTSNSTIGSGIETMTNMKITFVSEVDRRYWVEVSGQVVIYDVEDFYLNGMDIRLRWAVGSSVSVSDTAMHDNIYRIRRHYSASVFSDVPLPFYCLGEFVPDVAGNVTVGLTVQGVYSGDDNFVKASSTSPAYMLVRDVGPA